MTWCQTWEPHPASGVLRERLTAKFGPEHADGVTIERAAESVGLEVEVVAIQLGTWESGGPLHHAGVDGNRFTVGDLLEWAVGRYREWLAEKRGGDAHATRDR